MLRTALGAAVLLQGFRHFSNSSEFVPGLLTSLTGASLVAGFLTPVAAISTSLLVAGCQVWPQMFGSNLFESPQAFAFAITLGAGVFLLGPGAYSLDARLFGPREIVIPPVHDPRR